MFTWMIDWYQGHIHSTIQSCIFLPDSGPWTLLAFNKGDSSQLLCLWQLRKVWQLQSYSTCSTLFLPSTSIQLPSCFLADCPFPSTYQCCSSLPGSHPRLRPLTNCLLVSPPAFLYKLSLPFIECPNNATSNAKLVSLVVLVNACVLTITWLLTILNIACLWAVCLNLNLPLNSGLDFGYWTPLIPASTKSAVSFYYIGKAKRKLRQCIQDHIYDINKGRISKPIARHVGFYHKFNT